MKKLLIILCLLSMICTAGAVTNVFIGETLSLYDEDVNTQKSFCSIFVFNSSTDRLIDRSSFRQDCVITSNVVGASDSTITIDSNSFKNLCHHQKQDGLFTAFIEIDSDKYELDNSYYTDVKCEDGTSILFNDFTVILPKPPNAVMLWLRWSIKNLSLIIAGLIFFVFTVFILAIILKWARGIK